MTSFKKWKNVKKSIWFWKSMKKKNIAFQKSKKKMSQ